MSLAEPFAAVATLASALFLTRVPPSLRRSRGAMPQDPGICNRLVSLVSRPGHEEETKKRRGRMERRIVTVTKDLRRISMLERWGNLKCLVQVTRERSILSTRKASTERRATSPVTQNSRR
jgi:hypothetical protein